MFIIVVVSLAVGLFGYFLGRGQAALFYEREIIGLMEDLKTKREVIRMLRKRVEQLELGEGWKPDDYCCEEDEADWWKYGGEAPY
jgi:hypothetical protein